MCEDGCSFAKRLWMYEWSVGKGRDSLYERCGAAARDFVNMRVMQLCQTMYMCVGSRCTERIRCQSTNMWEGWCCTEVNTSLNDLVAPNQVYMRGDGCGRTEIFFPFELSVGKRRVLLCGVV
jgi:hypothetical protein